MFAQFWAPARPGEGGEKGEAAGHRRGDSQVEEGRELVTRTSPTGCVFAYLHL